MREFKIPPRPRDSTIREAIAALESPHTVMECKAAAQVMRDLWRHLKATERQMSEVTNALTAGAESLKGSLRKVGMWRDK